MTAKWNLKDAGYIISERINALNIDTVITFDSYGVSGHVNHKDTHAAVKRIMKNHQGVQFFELRSTPLPVKFTRWFGIIYDCLFLNKRRGDVVCVNDYLLNVWMAMLKHKSQFVWFRAFYLLFSTYVDYNILHPME